MSALEREEVEDTEFRPQEEDEGEGDSDSEGEEPASDARSSAAPRRRRYNTYSLYIYKVLKMVHPEVGISRKAMAIMDSFVNDILERLAAEASRITTATGQDVLSAREVETVVRLLLPGELAKHAVAEGNKALAKYHATASGGHQSEDDDDGNEAEDADHATASGEQHGSEDGEDESKDESSVDDGEESEEERRSEEAARVTVTDHGRYELTSGKGPFSLEIASVGDDPAFMLRWDKNRITPPKGKRRTVTLTIELDEEYDGALVVLKKKDTALEKAALSPSVSAPKKKATKRAPAKKKKKDPNAPKRPMSAYLIFSMHQREKVSREHPDMRLVDRVKLIAEMWKGFSDAEREPYNAMARADKERYEREMEGYEQSAANEE